MSAEDEARIFAQARGDDSTDDDQTDSGRSDGVAAEGVTFPTDQDDENAAFTTNFTMGNNASGTNTVMELGEGATFRATRVRFATDTDPSGGISWGLFVGDRRVAPLNEDYHQGRSGANLPMEAIVDVGGSIEVRWTNDGQSGIVGVVTVEGILVRRS